MLGQNSKEPFFTTSMQTRKNTIAVPSLSIDSPSSKVLNLILVPSSFSKATTATGSVVEIILPITKHYGIDNS